ncbi:MAG: hypothetical protein AB3X44_16165 [Leptothrix sp. (in: b-proteobacteria)]
MRPNKTLLYVRLALQSSPKPQTVAEIATLVKKDRNAVYRNLLRLVESGEVCVHGTKRVQGGTTLVWGLV